jgi:hypothetical protein
MILVSLHTKSSSMFHAEFVYKLFPPKWRILTMKTLSYKFWPNNITSFFSFPVMFYLPCADHVLLFVDDVVTSWPQTKISWLLRDKMYRDPCCKEQNMFYPKVCIMQLLKVAWYRVITLFTLYCLVCDTSIMILALPCNRGLSMLVLCAIDHGFEFQLAQTKDYKIGICQARSIKEKEPRLVGIRLMCPSVATCLPANCCFGELAL